MTVIMLPFGMVTSYLLQSNMYQAQIFVRQLLESPIEDFLAMYSHNTLLKYKVYFIVFKVYGHYTYGHMFLKNTRSYQK